MTMPSDISGVNTEEDTIDVDGDVFQEAFDFFPSVVVPFVDFVFSVNTPDVMGGSDGDLLQFSDNFVPVVSSLPSPDLVSGVDSPDGSVRSSGDMFQRSADFVPGVSGISSILPDFISGINSPDVLGGSDGDLFQMSAEFFPGVSGEVPDLVSGVDTVDGVISAD